MFLLGLLYVAVMAALIAAGVNFAFVFVLAGGLLFAQYYFSSKIALFSMNAHEVTPA
ncbi:MAG: heat shock protein HtpX, partial [Actinomycetota bacterium]|nr:heat shock protein HtpX [Actinomycetota bacterium]